MSNPNRDRLTRQQSIQCPFVNYQLDCYVECEGCPEKAERFAKINALIASGVKEVYDQYSPSWQHTRNQPGANFPKEVKE